MGADSTVLGVVIAVVGVIGSVIVARVSAPRPQPAGPVEVDEGLPVLEVAPEIWQHMSGKITTLEGKVDHLTALVEAQTVKVSTLEKLLRQSMRLLRSAHRQLRAAGTDPDPVPPELIPYSID
ncbi:hypothetical protein [Streptomyces sp. NBC_01565]|uniref:hypothetical protein n=1 Tax=Streptomyces sp. NBC_01565 TaxID=2975881 RepID=UPI002257C862|nr:hypothetical protein [Streptomyces sp. NBC_01565]MCX4540508.1 hypothetical protein [Streptomyces sp. NBC_01565]